MPQALKPLSLIHIGKGKFSQLPLLALWGNKNWLPSRAVNDSGLESAPEYEFGSFLEILDGDSGSGSFLVWSRFQPGTGSTTEAGTKWPC